MKITTWANFKSTGLQKRGLSHDPDRKQQGQTDGQTDGERVTDMYSA